MPDPQPGTDRRARRFLSPSQKYEIWLQRVRGEATIPEAADRLEVDRSTIMRIREVAPRRPGGAGYLQPGVRPNYVITAPATSTTYTATYRKR